MKMKINLLSALFFCFFFLLVSGCAQKTSQQGVFFNEMVDFAAIRTVAVLPFKNLSDDDEAGIRVRDVFSGMLLATEAVYVLPPGEVFRGIDRIGIRTPSTPSSEQIKRLSEVLDADVVITGVLREYKAVRSGSSTANIISLSLQMIETQTGSVIWSASSTKGGITIADRLFGGGGQPMNDITLECVNELLNKLFQ